MSSFLVDDEEEDEEELPDEDEPPRLHRLNLLDDSNGNSVNDGSDATTNHGCVNVTFNNYPALCETYIDPESLNQKVVMVLCLPSGAQNPKVELSDDGATAMVKCSWSKSIYEMEDLFKVPLAAATLNISHPKIMCLKNGLTKARKPVDVTPDTLIKVDLPIKVQTDPASWMHSGVKREDGTMAIVATFAGYINGYTKKVVDSTVKFEL